MAIDTAADRTTVSLRLCDGDALDDLWTQWGAC